MQMKIVSPFAKGLKKIIPLHKPEFHHEAIVSDKKIVSFLFLFPNAMQECIYWCVIIDHLKLSFIIPPEGGKSFID